MTKDELAAELLDQSHRPDLTAKTDQFILSAEGMIARDVRAMEQLGYVTLTDSDRTSTTSAIYLLPTDWLWDRALWIGTRALEKKSLAELRRLYSGADPQWFAIRGAASADAQMSLEVVGTPAEDAEIECEYFARMAALTTGSSTNNLLERHDELYIAAGLFFLYRYTQDMDMAQGFLDSFAHAAKSLNEQAAAKITGQSIAPAYNFHTRESF